jgi:hypothetical protein
VKEMAENAKESKIEQLGRLLLQNEQKMTRERDLINLCNSMEELESYIPELQQRFAGLGLNLIRTKYKSERFYVLTAPGKDDRVTPRMYGVLALFVALNNDIGQELPIAEAQNLFNDVWDDVNQLKMLQYLEETKEGDQTVLSVSPLAKAAFKNILKDLDIKKILSFVGK